MLFSWSEHGTGQPEYQANSEELAIYLISLNRDFVASSRASTNVLCPHSRCQAKGPLE
jgi:hypothetical protein